MNEELISIIVPIYKVEKYLPKCIESILVQTYKNLEILLVDDGSPDSCLEICNRFAERDTRIKVIHKKNGGLSDARNAGIDVANGKYLMFVDSDDYIEPMMAEELYDVLKKNCAEMSICSLQKVNDKGEILGDRFSVLKTEVLTPRQILSEKNFELYDWFWMVVWNKLYRADLFDNLRFPVGKMHEDEFLMPRLYLNCTRIACTQVVLYNYLQREDSIMSSAMSLKRLDVIEAFFYRAILYTERNEYKDIAYKELLRGIFFFHDYLAKKGYKDTGFKERYKGLAKLFRCAYFKTRGTKCGVDLKDRIWLNVNYVNIYGGYLVRPLFYRKES